MRHHLVTIGGEERRLRYGRAPLLDAQKKAGRTVGQLFGGLVSMDIEAMQVLLWAALRTEKPTTSYEDAGKVFDRWLDDGADLVDVQEALHEAAIASGLFRRADSEGEVEDADPKASRSGAET